jgi:hypothetical protein
MLSVAARSGAGDWVRRQGKRGCCSRGRVRERTEKRGCGHGGRRLLKRRRGEAGEGRSARVCHAAEGEGEKGGLRGADSQTAGSGWLRVAL